MTSPTAVVINFNVGGKRYEVSRSLFESQSDTMLAKIASSKQCQEDPESETIFIDRDGTIFGYVLNYLRDGKVKLPITERKDTLGRDLEYYNVDYDADKIDFDDAKEQMAKLIPAYEYCMQILKDQSESAHTLCLTNCIAVYCVEQFFLQHIFGQKNGSSTSGCGPPAQPSANDLKAIKATASPGSFGLSTLVPDSAVGKVIANFRTLRRHYDEAYIIRTVNSQIGALGLMIVSCEDKSNGSGTSNSEKSITFNMRQRRLYFTSFL
mmetsp:Transcript_1481/g.2290  ORF Transcript_1481/g.2290 Transcript_1481/m.2290 type:complete len:266 (-) Transcript_1481:272-1069(-)